jgi:hypothetical protein
MSNTSASAVPPADGHSSFFNRFSALVPAVVATVRVSVCAVAPVIVTEVGDKAQVGPLATNGLIEHVRFTVPVNPFAGVTVMVTVFPVVAPGAILTDVVLGVTVKGGAATVTAMVADAVRVPEVPVMVTVTGPPVVAVLMAVRVSALEPLEIGFGLNDAVTPVGRPLAAKVTAPLNPPTSVNAMLLVPLFPWTTVTLPGEGASVKPGATLTVSATVAVSVRVPEVPVIVTVTGPPVAAVLFAVNVNKLEPVVVGFGLNDAVTPLGRPEADRVTPPVNPFEGVTVMLSVLLLP